MAQEIYTEIEINAPAAKVWETIMDFEAHPDWNPFIKSISGDKSVGSGLEVVVEPVGKSPMTFKPTVRVYEEQKKFAWLGRFLLPKIVDGEHSFEVIETSENTTKLIHKERFTGILTGIFMRMYKEPTRQGFELMNQALKEKVEG